MVLNEHDKNNDKKKENRSMLNNQNFLGFQTYKDSLRPLIILIGILGLVFFVIIIFDKFKIGYLAGLIGKPNADNVVGGLLANAGGEIILGLLGIVMTVVAIIVELAANRYTARVSDLFVRDKVNLTFLILLASTSLNLVIILYFSRGITIPHVLINITVVTMAVCIITLVPYFIYVFKFLEPNSIISKIEKDILKYVKSARSISVVTSKNEKKKIHFCQARVVQGVDQLTDIILNSIQKKDNVLATNCIKSLTNFVIEYLEIKKEQKFHKYWYFPSDYVRYNNADFVTLMDNSFQSIIDEKNWVEHKLFRQLRTAFQESLNIARDICSYTSQCFYQIGIAAVRAGDMNTCQLVIKFFNTLLRATINAKDVRSCFNLLNHYRLFGECLVAAKNEKLLIDIASHFKYYGSLANEAKNMPFVLETAAHDLCDLNIAAYKQKIDKKGEILDLILAIDNPLERESERTILRGVRKSHVILATYYLSTNTKDSLKIARRIFNDILDDVINEEGGYERIFSIIKELKYLKAEFWEIIDRGFNIDYVPDDQKKYLQTILDWINIRQILYFAYCLQNNENKKAHKIMKEFNHIIKWLPDDTPIELKEFEKIYGKKGIDSKPNVFDNILILINSLISVDSIESELEKLPEFSKLNINQKQLKAFVNGIKEFEKEFKKECCV